MIQRYHVTLSLCHGLQRIGGSGMGRHVGKAIGNDLNLAHRRPRRMRRTSAMRSRGLGLAKKLIFKLVVTAWSPISPSAAMMATYTAKSASMNIAAPEMVPPGRVWR